MTFTNVIDDFENQVLEKAKQSAQDVIANSSTNNADLSLLGKPTIRTKPISIGEVEFLATLFTDKQVLDYVNSVRNTDFVAVWQIYHNQGSVILPVTQAMIDDAGHDWQNRTVIAKNDIVNRAVAALRLNTSSPVINHIAMHIAYEETAPDSGEPYYKGIDTCAIYNVWN